MALRPEKFREKTFTKEPDYAVKTLIHVIEKSIEREKTLKPSYIDSQFK